MISPGGQENSPCLTCGNGRKFILILDRCSVHRKAVRLLREAGVDWVEVEWLPTYAPEDIDHLRQAVDHLIFNYSKSNGCISV